MKGKKLLSVSVVFLLVISIVLTGCGSSKNGGADNNEKTGGESSSKVKLTFWNGFTADDGKVLAEIVNDYNKKSDGKAEIEMDVIPWPQLYQKLPPAIATKTAPSFVLMSGVEAPAYIANGSLQDMQDFFEVTGSDKSNFEPSSLAPGQVNGGQYLLPMQMQSVFLFWNKDLFKAAGLDPETPPQTYEELAEYAIKLTDSSKNQYGVGFPVNSAIAYFSSMIKGNGGEVVNGETKEVMLNSSENIETFKWLQNLALNEKVTPQGASGPDIANLMNSGNLGMMFNGPWGVAGLKNNDINFGVALPPAGKVKQSALAAGIFFAIPDGTSEAEKAAIYDFMNYWNSTEIVKKWSLINGFPPYLKTVIDDPEVQADPIVSVMSTMNNIIEPWLSVVEAARIENDVLFPLIEAVSLGGNVEDTLVKAAKQIEEIVGK